MIPRHVINFYFMKQANRNRLLFGMFLLIISICLINKITFYIPDDIYYNYYYMIMECKSLLVCSYILFVCIVLKCCIITKLFIFFSIVLDFITILYYLDVFRSEYYVIISKTITEIDILLAIILIITNSIRWHFYRKY